MWTMARVDSGNETLFSDESSPGTPCTPPCCSSDTPPRITGALTKDKLVIRPVAFKPVTMSTSRFTNQGERYGSTPILTRPGSHLTLYGSSNDLRHHGSNSNYSLDRKLMSSSPLALSSLPLTGGCGRLIGYDSLESMHKSPTPRSEHLARMLASEGSGSLADLTPSPCESGVINELEAALRERDSEVAYLRQTMEHNEQVIFRVYQEKERVWEREMRRNKILNENRLQAAAQKSHKLEQMLMMQTYQLQQDKKRLREEFERADREASELKQEVELLRGRLEDTEWSLCQKSGELSLLKTQLKESQGEQVIKVHEVETLRNEVDELRIQVEEKDAELVSLYAASETYVKQKEENEELKVIIKDLRTKLDLIENSKETKEFTTNKTKYEAENNVQRLTDKIDELTEKLKSERVEWERERLRWANEKEKVLSYQRQLQLNYVQMYRRTRSFEAQVQALTLELEVEPKADRKKMSSMAQTAIQL